MFFLCAKKNQKVLGKGARKCLHFLGRGAASVNGSLLKRSEKAATQAPAATRLCRPRNVKNKVALSPAKAGAPPKWEPS